MRHGLPPPLPSPFPSPSPSPAPAADQTMLLSVFLALFLPCAGMSAVFIVYICLLWYTTSNRTDIPLPMKSMGEKGLSPSELDKLPKITGKDLVMGTECAVCLDEIQAEQAARVVPGCNHGFHLECADTWLSKRPACPVCRSKIDFKSLPPPPPPDQEEDSPC